MAKKKKKQPAKKRDRGRIIELDRDIPSIKNSCEDNIESNLEDSYDKSKFINKFDSHIFANIKDVFYKYRLNLKKNEVERMYGKIFLPLDSRKYIKNIEIENLNLKINKFNYVQLEKENEIKPVYYEQYCFKEFDSSKYYENLNKLTMYKQILNIKINKLIIGLGGSSIYETSITLHHIYGIPYIPGSAIKGMFRNYIIENRFSNNEENAYKENWFKRIFGFNEHQGEVYFFDAFFENYEIKKDIMNSHYPKYYSNEKPPADNQNPLPINFLIVSKGNTKIVLGYTKSIKNLVIDNKNFVDWLSFNLNQAFKNFGIGAKTSVGYGYLY